jgi:3-oxoacyl-(acyl-carrier-protein) synthase
MGTMGRICANDDESRIVVTGMGVVSTIGETVAEFRDGLIHGRSGITRWKQMDPRTYSKIGGDMCDFDLKAHLERVGQQYPPDLIHRACLVLRATPLTGCLAAAAGLQAYLDAGLPDPTIQPERLGHVLAGNNLNMQYFVENVLEFDQNPDYIDPLLGVVLWDTDVLGKLGELLTIKGCNYMVGNACASGNVALLSAADQLLLGRVDAVVVSAASQELDPVALQGWALVNALSWRSFIDEPSRASRPWDVLRDGFVPGEGAAAVVLETLAGARARGAHIYAELLGGMTTCTATRLPRPSLEGQVHAMQQALVGARIRPEQVNYINAHATSTVLGDAVEVEAIKTVYGDHAYRIPVNATKSMIGHCLTAASLIEFVAILVQMQNGFVHPTINLDEPGPGLDLDFVGGQARQYQIKVAVSNSFGFGGLNSCIVVSGPP